MEEGVVHYCVTNMPGAYPKTASIALSNATLPFILELAKNGLKTKNKPLRLGFNLVEGKTTNPALAKQFEQEFQKLEILVIYPWVQTTK